MARLEANKMVAQRWAARWASRGWPPLSLLFYPLTLFYAYWFSASLVFASNSRPKAASLSTAVAQGQLP